MVAAAYRADRLGGRFTGCLQFMFSALLFHFIDCLNVDVTVAGAFLIAQFPICYLRQTLTPAPLPLVALPFSYRNHRPRFILLSTRHTTDFPSVRGADCLRSEPTRHLPTTSTPCRCDGTTCGSIPALPTHTTSATLTPLRIDAGVPFCGVTAPPYDVLVCGDNYLTTTRSDGALRDPDCYLSDSV